jgi:phage terminase large subunit-like protein
VLPEGSGRWGAKRWHQYHSERAASIGCVYDPERADSVVEFFSLLRHVKGRWGGDPFTLLPWQEHEIVRPFYGYIDPATDRRVYKRCFIAVAKKNGKTALCAGLALFGLFCENEPGAEVYSCAADRDQASLVFQSAAPMVRNEPTLSSLSKVLEVQRRIVFPQTNSFYQVLSAEVDTKHGLSPNYVIFDELHAQPNRHLWDVMSQGAFAAREEPALFTITTAGYDQLSICYEEWQYAKDVASGRIEDPHLLPVIYEVPEDADWTDEKTWRLANPSLGVTITLEDMRAEFTKAQRLPSNENAFRRLRLNQWTQQETRWLSMEAWDACGPHTDLVGLAEERKQAMERLKGRQAIGWLDLSSKTDITTFGLLFPGDTVEVLPFFFIPEEGLRERGDRDHALYQEWARLGFVHTTPGNVTDYRFVRETINKVREDYKFLAIAYDDWNAGKLEVELSEEDGFSMVPVPQNISRMNAPTKDLLALVLSQRIDHHGDPVLRYMAGNLVVDVDNNERVRPTKAKSTGRIDGIVGIIMALAEASRLDETPSTVPVVFDF